MDLNRRKFVAASIGTASLGLAGCIDSVETVDELPRPTIGEDDAPVTLESYDDLMCPACQEFSLQVLPQVVEEYVDTGDVKVQFYDWPIPVQPRWSHELANASRYVQDLEGNDAYYQFKTQLYENQSNISVDMLRQIGEEQGVTDVDSLIEDAANSVYQPVIDADKSDGTERGVDVTPTIFINGEVIPNYSFDVVSSTIDSNL